MNRFSGKSYLFLTEIDQELIFREDNICSRLKYMELIHK